MRRNNRIVAFASDNKHSGVVLSTLAEVYLVDMERRGLSPYTIKHEKENFASIMKLIPGDTLVVSITTELLEEQVFDVMRRRGLLPRTINGRIKSLRQLLKFAVERGYASFNHASGVRRMVEREDGIPSLANQQIDTLLQQCDLTTFTGLRDYTMIVVMLDTGIRLRELTDVKATKVDTKNKKIRDVLGKNRETKDIDVSKPVCAVLERYIQERNRRQMFTEALFVTIAGEPLKRSTIQKLIKHYGNAGGIKDVRVSPHTFRHTFVKQWILNGGDLPTLMRATRHKDLRTLLRYFHLWGHEIAERHEMFSPMGKRKLIPTRSIKVKFRKGTQQ